MTSEVNIRCIASDTVERVRATFGGLLRQLRQDGGFSQRRLAGEAGVSTRHLSCLENGKANPSREMVLALARTLSLPLRDQNRLLLSARYAPAFGDRDIDDEGFAPVVRALLLHLRSLDPSPALVMDRSWTLLYVNRSFSALHEEVAGVRLPSFTRVQGGPNLIDAFFEHYGAVTENAEEVLSLLLPRLRREAVTVPDILRRLHRWGALRPTGTSVASVDRDSVVVPFRLRIRERSLRLFTTYTRLGTATDVTAEGLTIETFHPADDATRELLHTDHTAPASVWQSRSVSSSKGK